MISSTSLSQSWLSLRQSISNTLRDWINNWIILVSCIARVTPNLFIILIEFFITVIRPLALASAFEVVILLILFILAWLPSLTALFGSWIGVRGSLAFLRDFWEIEAYEKEIGTLALPELEKILLNCNHLYFL